jgi:hypothetical protein
MATVALSKGLTALIDNEDEKLVGSFKWYAHDSGHGKIYAARRCHKTRQFTYLHRVLMNEPKGLEVDHINGDTLDNRRENLRTVTHRENLRNHCCRRNNPMHHIYRNRERWQVKSRAAGNIGTYTTIEEALKARDEAGI